MSAHLDKPLVYDSDQKTATRMSEIKPDLRSQICLLVYSFGDFEGVNNRDSKIEPIDNHNQELQKEIRQIVRLSHLTLFDSRIHVYQVALED